METTQNNYDPIGHLPYLTANEVKLQKQGRPYKELESCIRCMHESAGQKKTILLTRKYLYLVVTRVNYLSAVLWKEHMNKIIAQYPKLKQKQKWAPIQKIGWLESSKKYRREYHERLLKEILELETNEKK